MNLLAQMHKSRSPFDSLRSLRAIKMLALGRAFLLEAGGIEPPSRDNRDDGLYMRSRCFNLGPGGDHRQPLPGPSRLFLAGSPTTE